MFVFHEGYARLCCVFAFRSPTLSAAHTQEAAPDEWNEYKMEETADGETGRVPVGNACKRHGQAYARGFQAICSFEMLCSQYHSDQITKAAFDQADQHLQAGKFQEVLAEAVITWSDNATLSNMHMEVGSLWGKASPKKKVALLQEIGDALVGRRVAAMMVSKSSTLQLPRPTAHLWAARSRWL
jgi:hypothetical protein